MKDKRLRVTYFVMFLWIAFGAIGIAFRHYGINLSITLSGMAMYFATLSTFVASYYFSESYRSSDDKTPMFKKGPTSKREVLINFIIIIWFVFGVYGLYRKIDITDMSAYFTVFLPFASGYIIAEGLKKNILSNTTVKISSKSTDIDTETTISNNDVVSSNINTTTDTDTTSTTIDNSQTV